MENSSTPERYVEVVFDSFTNRNTVIRTSELDGWIAKAQEQEVPLYRSYYQYGENVVEHIKNTGSIADYQGPFFVDQLIIDVDKGKSSPEEVLADAQSITDLLISSLKLKPEQFEIFFSGNGYHIQIPDIFRFGDGPVSPQTVRSTLETLFPKADSGVADRGKIIRVAGTINHKSGLYKIPLSYHELKSLTPYEIMDLAKEPRTALIGHSGEPNKSEDRDSGLTIPDWSSLVVNGSSKQPTAASSSASATGASDPLNVLTCMQTVYNRGPVHGSRHHESLRLASAYRRAGVPREGVVALLLSWAQRDPTPLSEKDIRKHVDDVFNKPYVYGCQDEIMTKYCDPHCVFFKTRDTAVSIVHADKANQELAKFLSTESQHYVDLSEVFSNVPQHRCYPGEFVAIIGDTGLGKTAFVQNIAVRTKKMRILYLSLEVGQNLLWRRFIQIDRAMTKDEVQNHYRQFPDVNLGKGLGHLQVVTVSPNLDEIERVIAVSGAKVIVFDTLDGIEVEYAKDEIEQTKRIAVRLKQIAEKQNVIIFGVHHISKFAAVSNQQLSVHSAKGSSSIEQKADKVIGIEGSMHHSPRLVRSLKARDESPFQAKFLYRFDTFIYEEVPTLQTVGKSLSATMGQTFQLLSVGSPTSTAEADAALQEVSI